MGQELLRTLTGSFLGQVQRHRESVLLTHLEICRLAPFFSPYPSIHWTENKKKEKKGGGKVCNFLICVWWLTNVSYLVSVHLLCWLFNSQKYWKTATQVILVLVTIFGWGLGPEDKTKFECVLGSSVSFLWDSSLRHWKASLRLFSETILQLFLYTNITVFWVCCILRKCLG